MEAGADHIEVWGTGSASREFLYVDDAAEGIVLAAERYDGADPVNLGTDEELPIRDLVKLIADATGFTGEIRWDASKPDGQPRRRVDPSRAASSLRLRGPRCRSPRACAAPWTGTSPTAPRPTPATTERRGPRVRTVRASLATHALHGAGGWPGSPCWPRAPASTPPADDLGHRGGGAGRQALLPQAPGQDLVVGHAHRLAGWLTRATAADQAPAEPVGRALEALPERHDGLPAELLAGQGDVGLALRRVVDRQRLVDDLGRRRR